MDNTNRPAASVGTIILLIIGGWILWGLMSSGSSEPYHSTTNTYTNTDGSSTYTNTDNTGTFSCTFSKDYSHSDCGDK